jgi:peptidyl-tRNA hydrolase, PTH1 family
MTAWLVVGLGNPGARFAATRHNIGVGVVERLADRLDVRLRKVRFLPLESGEAVHPGAQLWLVRPQTFMNVSGPPVGSFAKRRRIDPGHVIACHDEIDLAFGALKVKRGGSTAGHHGLDSLAEGLRSTDFIRVRLGVGRPPGRQEPADYVLQPFPKAQHEEAELLAEEGANAVLTVVTEGLPAAQDRHNRSQPSR